MDEHRLIVLEPALEDIQFLEDRLTEFNARATGITDAASLAIVVRDHERRIIAGICGYTWGGTCEVRQFWVDESRRRHGLGTRMLAAVECEARHRGCRQIVLMTFTFQAPDFYRRHGFDVVAALGDHPQGHANLLMRKPLDSPDRF
jgi:GNAT superfamily N-acetyltransferase